ncbi:MAG: hypothetical protein BWX80_02932 [Candidatus Hydrogenedentes bacterium ADurb.Bin101]|nr:MAG: hypothetical protein BWX80_02932 [Candidatus Hydrogenedentes bacterium ADurb.Bin101]
MLVLFGGLGAPAPHLRFIPAIPQGLVGYFPDQHGRVCVEGVVHGLQVATAGVRIFGQVNCRARVDPGVYPVPLQPVKGGTVGAGPDQVKTRLRCARQFGVFRRVLIKTHYEDPGAVNVQHTVRFHGDFRREGAVTHSQKK